MQVSKPIVPEKGTRTPHAAFTLVEVMISALIGAIIFAALFYGMGQGNYIIQVDRENLRATQIILNRLEGIRLCRWGDDSGTNSTQLFSATYIPSAFTDYFYPNSIGNSSNGVVNGTVYFGTITIQTNAVGGPNNFVYYSATNTTVSPPSYSNQMALVTVTLTWSDAHSGFVNTFHRTNKAYIAQNGMQNYIAQ